MSSSHCCTYPTWDCIIIIIIIIINVSNEKQHDGNLTRGGRSFLVAPLIRAGQRDQPAAGSDGWPDKKLSRPDLFLFTCNSLPSWYTCAPEEKERSARILMKYCIHREGAPKGARQGSSWRRMRTERLPKGTSWLKGDFWVWSFNYVAEALVNTLAVRRNSAGGTEIHVNRYILSSFVSETYERSKNVNWPKL
jgi:hypothetical protein